jgi:hypothetical protein
MLLHAALKQLINRTRFKPNLLGGLTLRIDYAVIGLSIIFLAVSMYLAGLSLQMTDLPTRAQIVTYATYLFSSSMVLLVLVAIVSIIKKAIAKPTY